MLNEASKFASNWVARPRERKGNEEQDGNRSKGLRGMYEFMNLIELAGMRACGLWVDTITFDVSESDTHTQSTCSFPSNKLWFRADRDKLYLYSFLSSICSPGIQRSKPAECCFAFVESIANTNTSIETGWISCDAVKQGNLPKEEKLNNWIRFSQRGTCLCVVFGCIKYIPDHTSQHRCSVSYTVVGKIRKQRAQRTANKSPRGILETKCTQN